MKTTPNVFSLLKNPDLGGNIALFSNGEKQYIEMLGHKNAIGSSQKKKERKKERKKKKTED